MKKLKLSFVLLSLLCVFAYTPARAEAVNYKMIYAGDSTSSSYLGVKQGLAEANLQGQFLGQSYTLDTVSSTDALSNDYSDYLAVFTDVDHDTYSKLVGTLPGVAIFNLTLDADDLRAACLPNALHIPPSQKMKLDAEAQWQKKTPDSKASAQAWHYSFHKYAARELNNRFRKANDVNMDDDAWAGWAAIKIVTDTVARQKITDAGKLLDFLRQDLVFDGQKGTDMSFRETGQLRQILLLVDNEKIVAEAPVIGIAKPSDVDTLGSIDCAK